jgi:hypothetical protein
LKFRFLDGAVFALAAGITVLAALRIYGGGGDRTYLRVDGRSGSWVYPLDRTEQVEIPGPLGVTVVELSGGGARVLSSPCTNKTCIASGTIRRRGQWAACLPNGVSLAIEGGRADGNLDAASF